MGNQKEFRERRSRLPGLVSIYLAALAAGFSLILTFPSASADHTMYSSVLSQQWGYAMIYIFIWNYPSNFLYLLYGVVVNRLHHFRSVGGQGGGAVSEVSVPRRVLLSRRKEISLIALYTAIVTFIGANTDYYLPFNLTERWEGLHKVYIVAEIDPVGFPIALGIIFLTFYLPFSMHLRVKKRWAVLSASIAVSMNAFLWYLMANMHYLFRNIDLFAEFFYLSIALYITVIVSSIYYLKFWRIPEEEEEEIPDEKTENQEWAPAD